MSLDLGRLEKVKGISNGVVQARCPACAEGGHDRAGEHLLVYPDGRFGCCVHRKDREHRKRIFALAGDKTPRQFTVKVVSDKPPVKSARSVIAFLAGLLRTPRTGVSEPDSSRAGSQEEFRTLRTHVLMSRAYAREDNNDPYTCKDNEKGVLSVLSPSGVRMPYFTPDGTLVIPFDSPDRFHWWKPDGHRQSVKDTRAELRRKLLSPEIPPGT